MKKRFLTVAPLLALCLSSCATNVHHNVGDYLVKSIEHTGDFNILQLTDTHLGDKDDLDVQFKFLDYLIKDAGNDIDLIVITGDLFSFTSKSNAKKFFTFLDGHDTPWTVVFGNHDEQCNFNIDWLTSELNTKYKNCLFKDIQDDDVQGNCNFYVNITHSGTIYEQLIFMDSNRYDYSGFKGYDYFHQDQIDWYSSVIDSAPADAKSLMFYHIPLPEVNDAWEKGTKLDTEGVKREPSCPPNKNTGFFKVIKEKGSTQGMFFGHDHINDFAVKYEGVVFSYGVKSTDRVYYDEDMLGYQVITLHDDVEHTFDIQRSFHTYAEVE